MLVRANGSKRRLLKYRVASKEKLLAFGAYPGVRLADARLRRVEAKVAPGKCVDAGAKDAWETVTTFEQGALAWHASRLASLGRAFFGAAHAARA